MDSLTAPSDCSRGVIPARPTSLKLNRLVWFEGCRIPVEDDYQNYQNREASLLELRYDIAYIRLLVADLRRHLALKTGFNPDQPRDDHGRWTDAGGGTQVAEGARPYSVLLAEEEARGGHAIRTHVGKSDEELLATLRAMRIDTPFVTIAKDAQSSFNSLGSANDFVNRVLETKSPMVDLVASGALK